MGRKAGLQTAACGLSCEFTVGDGGALVNGMPSSEVASLIEPRGEPGPEAVLPEPSLSSAKLLKANLGELCPEWRQDGGSEEERRGSTSNASSSTSMKVFLTNNGRGD